MDHIAIVGGGASGLVAAISAARASSDLRITIYEKNQTLGRKIYATGNGRCNITNLKCKDRPIVESFFDTVGIPIKYDEEGRGYPFSEQAKDVAEALIEGVNEFNNIKIMSNISIKSIEKFKNEFIINGEYRAEKVILAMGGKAGSKFGTTGDGYSLLKKFGHRINKLVPVLTGIETAEAANLKEKNLSLEGCRLNGEIKLILTDGGIERTVFQEIGNIQFMNYGISGICVFNGSRFLKLGQGVRFEDFYVEIDCVPDFNKKELVEFIRRREAAGLDALRGLLPEKIAAYIRHRGEDISNHLKSLRFQVKGARGWESAQGTSGGAAFEEFSGNTLESTLVDGLYCAGEILDYDGPCGGYNLSNAWITGLKAGENAAGSILLDQADTSHI